MFHKRLCLAATLLALGAVTPAQAATPINVDTTLDGTTAAISDDVLVTNGAVLTLNPGGLITGTVTAQDTSTVNLSGGARSRSSAATWC